MLHLRRQLRFVSLFTVFFLVLVSVPYQPVLAAMISTDEMVSSQRAAEAREYINTVMARQEIQDALINRGIDPLEAQARIDSLTDTEAIQLADRIDNVPAGGDAFGVLIGAALVVFVILIITDALGITDVFPFVKG